jgi:competence protein ComEC
LIGLFALLMPGLAELWYTLLGTLSGMTFDILAWFSSMPFALLTIPEQGVFLWLSILVGCMLLLMPGGVPGRGMGVLLCLPILLTTPQRPGDGEVWFTLLDVGQGLACVVETRNHLLIYDTGPKRGIGSGAAESVIIPFLRSRGYEHIDVLVVSNGDSDHAGGVDSLTKAISAERILAGEAEMIDFAQPCKAGDAWFWDGVGFYLLHPHNGTEYKDSNDRSCVLKIVSGERSILLPGDIEKAGEDSLLRQNPDRLKSWLVVAPHHGSNSSSTSEFVAAVDPKWILFSTGYKNSYGFPKPEVVQRWQAQGADILNTALTGAIEFRIVPGEMDPVPRLYRDWNSRYWQHKAE